MFTKLEKIPIRRIVLSTLSTTDPSYIPFLPFPMLCCNVIPFIQQTTDQAEGCKQQENMGVSVRALLKAGVAEGKIPDAELQKMEIKTTKQPMWFNPAVGGHSSEVEEESP